MRGNGGAGRQAESEGPGAGAYDPVLPGGGGGHAFGREAQRRLDAGERARRETPAVGEYE